MATTEKVPVSSGIASRGKRRPRQGWILSTGPETHQLISYLGNCSQGSLGEPQLCATKEQSLYLFPQGEMAQAQCSWRRFHSRRWVFSAAMAPGRTEAHLRNSWKARFETSGVTHRSSVLNRLVAWTSSGIEMEADPRRVELVLEHLGLESNDWQRR